ncbi:MAG TPA: hypothetical protein VFX35_07665 [Solirubrobacterales bacterium]|nr:hypothetical protein [Solirubrobacterales bacterium]
MSKKIIMACMAVAALAAFALPASASASKMTLEENGVPLNTTGQTCTGKAGICILATNKDANGNHLVSKFTDANGNTLVECTTADLTGRLEKNTHEEIAGTIETATFEGTANVTPRTVDCGSATLGDVLVTPSTATNGLPWCVRSTAAMAADEVQIRGNECTAAARPLRFTLHPTSLGVPCTYERAGAVIGSITTTPAAAQITVTKQEFPGVAGNSFLCPGKGFLDLTMSLYTDNAEEKPLSVIAVP